MTVMVRQIARIHSYKVVIIFAVITQSMGMFKSHKYLQVLDTKCVCLTECLSMHSRELNLDQNGSGLLLRVVKRY